MPDFSTKWRLRQIGGRAEHTKEKDSFQRSRKRTPGYYARKEGENCQPKRPKSSRKSRTKVGVVMADLSGSTAPKLCSEDRGAADGLKRQFKEAS